MPTGKVAAKITPNHCPRRLAPSWLPIKDTPTKLPIIVDHSTKLAKRSPLERT